MTRTSEDLRDVLFATLYEVKTGRCSPETANAIAKLSAQIINTVSVEIMFYKNVTKEGGGNGYAPTTQITLSRRNRKDSEDEPSEPDGPARDRVAAIARRPV